MGLEAALARFPSLAHATNTGRIDHTASSTARSSAQGNNGRTLELVQERATADKVSLRTEGAGRVARLGRIELLPVLERGIEIQEDQVGLIRSVNELVGDQSLLIILVDVSLVAPDVHDVLSDLLGVLELERREVGVKEIARQVCGEAGGSLFGQRVNEELLADVIAADDGHLALVELVVPFLAIELERVFPLADVLGAVIRTSKLELGLELPRPLGGRWRGRVQRDKEKEDGQGEEKTLMHVVVVLYYIFI